MGTLLVLPDFGPFFGFGLPGQLLSFFGECAFISFSGQERIRHVLLPFVRVRSHAADVPLPLLQGKGTSAKKMKNQPKEEVLGRISLRTSGEKLRSGPPNLGKRSILARTPRADIHEKTSA